VIVGGLSPPALPITGPFEHTGAMAGEEQAQRLAFAQLTERGRSFSI
jgi:hypothetical protein